MDRIRPHPDLQVNHLKKQFQKSESLKKTIKETKSKKRNEILVKKALEEREGVIANLSRLGLSEYESRLENKLKIKHSNEDI